jgi:primosomal protein N'
MILITVRGEREDMARLACETLHRHIKAGLPEGIYLGEASPAPITKIKANYRFQIALRGPVATQMSRVIRSAVEAMTLPSDVDAQYLL